MKTRKIKSLVPILLGMALILTACGTVTAPNTSAGLPQSAGVTAVNTAKMQTQVPLDTNDTSSEAQSVVQNFPDDSEVDPLEYWNIDEFERWMEQQHEENQRLADNHDKSFYEKGANGDYYCREWTQADVDALYDQWQEQLSLMEQGYHFTKEITLPDGGLLAGAFDPETWNAKPGVAPGSTIITLPDKSTVDLGHFDTAEEARQAVEQYLMQQVKDGLLTQAEADKILSNGATE